MTIERARPRSLLKPWGVTDVLPWSRADHAGMAIGEISYERNSASAPRPALLLKVLLTSQPLSIQVHPDDAMAHAMNLPNGKTEAWYILGAEPGAKVALGWRRPVTPLLLRAAIDDGSIAELIAWKSVAVGDAIAVPAGTVHAIGAGLVIAEIQQRSDTTFRLFDHGLGRELHIEHGLAAAINCPAQAQAQPEHLTAERTLLVANPYFVFERIELAAGSAWLLEASRETWMLVTAGSVDVGALDLTAGDAVFAESDRVTLQPGETGATCLVAYAGAGGPIAQLLQSAPQRMPIGARRSSDGLSPGRSQTQALLSTIGTHQCSRFSV